MASTNPARGMRDFLPADVRKREYVIGIIKQTYESYGFEPLETPAVENIDTLMGKYGEEGNQLIFRVLVRGGKLDTVLQRIRNTIMHVRADAPIQEVSQTIPLSNLADLALRYDLTVPFARVVGHYKEEIPKFFKRYQIQPVWRADRPGRGRFREFYQCDVDCIGSESELVEVDIISAAATILNRLGFSDFVVRVNHRKILQALLEVAGVPNQKHNDALIALDKIDKIGREGVVSELRTRGLSNESEIKLVTFLDYFITAKSTEVFEDQTKRRLLDFLKDYHLRIETIADAKGALEKADQLGSRSVDDTEATRSLKENLSIVLQAFEDYGKEIDELSEQCQVNRASDGYLILDKLLHEMKRVTAGQMIAVRPVIPLLRFTGGNVAGLYGAYNLVRILKRASIVTPSLNIDPTLSRGLSYYTGAIIEINVPDLAGSLGGGGRYDGLIGMFGKEQIPACGFSLGLERILVVMEERGMFPPEIADSTPADVMVTIRSEEAVAESLKLANELRTSGLRVTLYPEPDKLGKQLKYADSIKVPWVCVLGETELAEDKVTLKNMKTGEQQTVGRDLVKSHIL